MQTPGAVGRASDPNAPERGSRSRGAPRRTQPLAATGRGWRAPGTRRAPLERRGSGRRYPRSFSLRRVGARFGSRAAWQAVQRCAYGMSARRFGAMGSSHSSHNP